IHSFILNEVPDQWGTGWGTWIPAGFEEDHADAVKMNFSDQYSINIFSTRVKNFRVWMAKKGEQNKPLWITEYGVLFPPIDLPEFLPDGTPNPDYTGDIVNISDSITRDFMLKTFDFLLTTRDSNTGLPNDNYHLVQRWFWYSLNDHPYHMGGSWYDPDSIPPNKITPVGTGYVNYAAKNNVKTEIHFTSDPITDSEGHTKFDFGVINSGSSLKGSAKIWVYYNDPNGTPITWIDTGLVRGCGEMMDVTFNLSTPPPSNVNDVFFRLDTNADLVPNSGDEIKSISMLSARSPAYGEVLLNNRPTITWDGVAGATKYNLQVSTALNFPSYVLNITTSSLNYTMTSDLASNRLMYWRTRAKSGSTYGAWSAVWQFRTANSPSIPSLVSPANNSLITFYTPLLDWKDSTYYPHHYQIQIATEKTFSSTGSVKDTTVTGSSYTTETLQSNTLYYWRVRAFSITGRYSTWSSIWSFRAAIVPPTLVSPADGSSLPDRRPPLDWENVNGANGYSIQISKYSNFSSTVMTGSPTALTYTSSSDLAAHTQLYWRVRTKGTNGPSAWSSVWSFTTANPPGVPSLSSPSNKALTTNYRPKLDWSNSSLPSGTTFDYYEVQVATDNTFAPPLPELHVVDRMTSDYTPASDLAPNATYYWRVRAWNTAGQYSAWSSTRSFRTAILPPVLLSPDNGTRSVLTRRPPLDWDGVDGASGYSVQISRYYNFSSTVKTASPTASDYTPSSDLPANTTLYWRVQAKGTNGPSAWSEKRSFTTANPPGVQTLSSPSNNVVTTNYRPKLDWSNSSLPSG
ncbi:MAG: hypothetical protein IMZ61_08545, partial [Planctomycetes bacterium]|nr:hypothetical protein [Planctomycetota bacterium]